MFEVFIIGSGPAGISASLYAARAGLRVAVISKDGGAISKAGKIENYYGFAAPLSGKDLYASGIEGAKRLGVEFIDGEAVSLLYENNFVISTLESRYEAKTVILATGSERAAPKIQGLADFEGRGLSFCAVCDAFFYRGKDVAVLGNGSFALHELEVLSGVANNIFLLTNGAALTADMPENIQIHDQKISSLEGGEKLERVVFANGESMDISGLFVAYGAAGSTALAKMAGAVTDGKNISVDKEMKTSIPGLFAAGDCTGGLLQISKAVHEGAEAGISAAKLVKAVK